MQIAPLKMILHLFKGKRFQQKHIKAKNCMTAAGQDGFSVKIHLGRAGTEEKGTLVSFGHFN